MALARLADGAMRLIGIVSEFLAMVSLAALVVLFIAIIGLRPFGITVPSADEFASILLAGTFVLGLAAAVAYDEHIEIRFVVNAMAPLPRRALALLAIVVSIVMVAVLFWGIWRLWADALARGSMMLGTLPIPRAIPLGVVMAGVALFELALGLKLIRFFTSRDAEVMKASI